MKEFKNILLIGRSGRGKSTLANVILNKNGQFEEVFKESMQSVSQTREIQSEEFEFYPEENRKIYKDLLDKLDQDNANSTSNKLNKSKGRSTSFIDKLKSLFSKLKKHSISSYIDVKNIDQEQFANEIVKIVNSGRDISLKEFDEEDKQTLQKVLREYLENMEIVKCHIIDTPGIGDTKLTENEVLDIIAGAVYLAKDGISQVFFVIDGRFEQSEMITYDLLRETIFDQDITNYTAVVRTRFENFRTKKNCEEDIERMKKGNNVKLAEIVKYRQGIIHVNNPPIDIKDESRWNEKLRTKSREKVLKHLRENHKAAFYRPPKLAQLSEEIADDYFQYLEKKKQLGEELKRLSSKVGQFSSVQSGKDGIFAKDNRKELDVEKNVQQIEKKEQVENENSIGIIEKKEVEENIARLQNKKERLEKEIAEKEKKIRQKVLRHIFNNYQEKQENLIGEIFLSNAIDDRNWQEISSKFADKELIIKWLKEGFNYQQTKDWSIVLDSKDKFDPKTDAGFCSWLRDVKEITVDKIKRLSYPSYRIEALRKEYFQRLRKETELLDKHNKQLSNQEKDWKDIRENFAKKEFSWNSKTYKQEWEERGLTYQDAREWILAGFEPSDSYSVKQWKHHKFTPEHVRVWIDIGLNKKDAEFVVYLKSKGYQPNPVLNLEELRKEFTQNYLDEHYPKNQRNTVKKLNISQRGLAGALDLSDFVNLEELYCQKNQLTDLKLDRCLELKVLYCYSNQLTELKVNHLDKLSTLYCESNKLTQLNLYSGNKIERINCRSNYLRDLNFFSTLSSERLSTLEIIDNSFPEQDLSIFSRFVNLEKLFIGNFNEKQISQGSYNHFIGSLESLKNLVKLKELGIDNTDIDSGLEYLPESIEKFYCSVKERKDAKVKSIYNLFTNDQGKVEEEKSNLGYEYVREFSKKLQNYKHQVQIIQPTS